MSLHPSYTILCDECHMPEHLVFYDEIPKGLQAKQDAALQHVKGYGWRCNLEGVTVCNECQTSTVARMDAMNNQCEGCGD